MNRDHTVRVALLVGDEVVEATDDEAVVRVSAALLAGRRRRVEDLELLAPITEGRRQVCRAIALGAG
jgi:hypothetical protein